MLCAQAPAPTEAPAVGRTGELRDLILPGGELEVLPGDSTTPLVVRITAVRPHGELFRYDVEYWARESGTYDLRDYLRRADGTPLGRIAAEMRVLCDRQGQPVEIRARRLNERTSLGQAGSERAGGSFGLGWLTPDALRPLAEEPATLWAAGGEGELRIDLQSAGGSGIAEVCGR